MWVRTLSKKISKGAWVLSSTYHVLSLSPNVLLLRVLLSIDRRQSVSEARDTVHLAAQYSSALTQHRARVVGIDLSGDPNVCG